MKKGYKDLTRKFIKYKSKNFFIIFMATLLTVAIFTLLKQLIQVPFFHFIFNIGLIISFYFILVKVKRNVFFFSKLIFNAIILEYKFTKKKPEMKKQVKKGEKILFDYFKTYDNSDNVDRKLQKSLSQINIWLFHQKEYFPFIPSEFKQLKYVYLFTTIFTNPLKHFVYTYMLLTEEENIWKASSEGIALYVQNWKDVEYFFTKKSMFLYILKFILTVVFTLVFQMILPVGLLETFMIMYILFDGIYEVFIESSIAIPIILFTADLIEEESVRMDTFRKLSKISTGYKQIIKNIKES